MKVKKLCDLLFKLNFSWFKMIRDSQRFFEVVNICLWLSANKLSKKQENLLKIQHQFILIGLNKSYSDLNYRIWRLFLISFHL